MKRFRLMGFLGPVACLLGAVWPGGARGQEDEPVWVIEPEDTTFTDVEEPGPSGDGVPRAEYLRLTITTTDSVRLGAWYLPPQDGYGNRLPGIHPGLLIVPREGETLASRARLASALADRGFAVLTFDHRGTGRSTPFAADPLALVYREYLTDVHSALDILEQAPEVDSSRVAILGESRGAYLALALVADRPEARAVVAVSVPKSWKDYLKTLQRERPGQAYYVPEGWRREHDPERVLNRFNGSVLFIVGDRDLVTPSWMSRELHDQYVRRKEFWEVPGASHDGARRPEALLGEDYYDRVASFLRAELDRPPHRGWPHR
jgi:pimeloyl-ACP methyl ester carboxylesterase